jgi:hypothetical protein
MLRNIPEERRFHLHRDGSLDSSLCARYLWEMIHIYYSNKKETPNTHFKQSNSFPEGQERVVHVHTQ